MTAAELITAIQRLIAGGMPPTVEVTAFNGDDEAVVPVTGFLYDDKTLEICTDDNS